MSDVTAATPVVGVVMGSDSDWPVMEAAADGARASSASPYEVDVVSAHRMPDEMIDYGRAAAGARAAGHHRRRRRGRPPAGMLASVTPLPVIGVPVPLKYLDGMDSLLSIVQMPAGVPVATVSIGGPATRGCSRRASSARATARRRSGCAGADRFPGRPARPGPRQGCRAAGAAAPAPQSRRCSAPPCPSRGAQPRVARRWLRGAACCPSLTHPEPRLARVPPGGRRPVSSSARGDHPLLEPHRVDLERGPCGRWRRRRPLPRGRS